MLNKRLYAAYGSNMNLKQMVRRCPNAKVVGKGVILDNKLVFAYKGVATMIPEAGQCVPVVLWEITRACEASLDIYEGYPKLYRKENFAIRMENGMVELAMAYIMNKPYSDILETPTDLYRQTIIEGYNDNGIDLINILK